MCEEEEERFFNLLNSPGADSCEALKKLNDAFKTPSVYRWLGEVGIPEVYKEMFEIEGETDEL